MSCIRTQISLPLWWAIFVVYHNSHRDASFFVEIKTQETWRDLVYTLILCYYRVIPQGWVAYVNPENMEHVPCCRYWEMCSEKLLGTETSILSETQVLQLYLSSTTRLPSENFCNNNILPQGQKIKEAERERQRWAH